MTSRIAAALRDDRGFTLVEMTVTLILTALIASSLFAVFLSFSQNTGNTRRQADLQRETRLIMADLVIGLRQAEPVHPNGYPVESLTASRIVYYSDQHEFEGPDRIVLERTDCQGGYCELWITRYAAVPGSGPHWQFEATPFEHSFIIGQVREDVDVFRGVEWAGEPPEKSYQASCSPSGPPCDFPLVSIVIRAEPPAVSEGARTVFELIEEVRLRNA